MTSSKVSGFTIIETMLFLAITGLLIMAIMMGTGNAINAKRYRDSVVSLQAVLQQQYSEVLNVSSTSDGTEACKSGAGVVPAGKSDCVVVGRYITSAGSSDTLTIKGVIADITGSSSTGSEIEQIADGYNVRVSPMDPTSYRLEWGTTWVEKSSHSQNFSILIIRSPISGTVRTFINNNQVITDNDIASLINVIYLERGLDVCVQPMGLFSAGASSVSIVANATNANGVVVAGEVTSGCQ